MVDDPGFRDRVAGLQEAGSEACARDRRLELAAYLQDRFPEAVESLRVPCRIQAEAPGGIEGKATEFFITVHQFTTVFVYPHGYPPSLDPAAWIPPAPGPSAWIMPRVLSLITTHRCTAACEHCCFSCSPALDKAIPIPRLHSLIDEAASIPTIQLIVFTGGECFLLGRHLDDLIRRCRNNGLHTRCVTNGYWAASPAAASSRAQELAAAGLQEINFSTGTFHAHYVPVERILWGAKACAAQGIRPLINIELFEGSDFPEERLTGDGELQDLQRDAGLIINRACWAPNGGEIWGCASQGRSSAARLEHPERVLRFSGSATRPPAQFPGRLADNPDQELITCCGLTLEHIPALHAGSLKIGPSGRPSPPSSRTCSRCGSTWKVPKGSWNGSRNAPGVECPWTRPTSATPASICTPARGPWLRFAPDAREVEERIMEQGYFLDSAGMDWAGRTALPQVE